MASDRPLSADIARLEALVATLATMVVTDGPRWHARRLHLITDVIIRLARAEWPGPAAPEPADVARRLDAAFVRLHTAPPHSPSDDDLAAAVAAEYLEGA